MRAPCVYEPCPGVRRRIWRGETRAWRPTMSPATPPADQQAHAQLGTELPRRAAAGPPAGPEAQYQGLGRVAAAWRAASWRKTTRSFSRIAAGLLVEQRALLSKQHCGWSARLRSRPLRAREEPGGAAVRAGTQSGLAVDPGRSAIVPLHASINTYEFKSAREPETLGPVLLRCILRLFESSVVLPAPRDSHAPHAITCG